MHARIDRDLIVLRRRRARHATAFAAGNARIIKETLRLAFDAASSVASRVRAGEPAAVALVVWEGSRRADQDATADFGALAHAAALRVKTVQTRI
jgi:hypothetical protein